MKYLNDFLYLCYIKGWNGFLYELMFTSAYIGVFVVLIPYRKKYDISLKDTLIISAIFPLITNLIIITVAWIESGFTEWGTNNILRACVYIPILFFVLAKALKIDYRRLLDFATPCLALVYAIGHLGCIFSGCCHGYPYYYGIWSPMAKNMVFPNQLIEIAVSLLIYVFLLEYAQKHKYKPTGKLYPLYLIVYGISRFFMEFLRDNKKLFWGISNLALHAAFMVLVGTVWYFFLKRKERKTAET